MWELFIKSLSSILIYCVGSRNERNIPGSHSSLGLFPDEYCPTLPIPSTDLFTGTTYKLGFKKYGAAPIGQITLNGYNQWDSWHRLAILKGQPKWPEDESGDTETESQFVFIPLPGKPIDNFFIVSLNNPVNILGVREENGVHFPVFFNRTSPDFGQNFVWTIHQEVVGSGGAYTIRNTAFPSEYLVPVEQGLSYPLLALKPTSSPAEDAYMWVQTSGATLTGSVVHMSYTQESSLPPGAMKEEPMASPRTLENNQPTNVLQEKIHASKIFTNTFTYNFPQSFSLFGNLTFSKDVSLLGRNNKVDSPIQVSLDEVQSATVNMDKNFELSEDISVPPMTVTKVTPILNVAHIKDLQFNAQIQVRMTSTRVMLPSFTAREHQPVSASMIAQFLKDNGVEGTVVSVSVKENFVELDINGTASGAYAINAIMKKQSSPAS